MESTVETIGRSRTQRTTGRRCFVGASSVLLTFWRRQQLLLKMAHRSRTAAALSLPETTGTPGYGTRIVMQAPPPNPSLARNPFNNVHNDSWLTATARIMVPSGVYPVGPMQRFFGDVRLRCVPLGLCEQAETTHG
jgi:hypothetical protein